MLKRNTGFQWIPLSYFYQLDAISSPIDRDIIIFCVKNDYSFDFANGDFMV